MLHIRPELAANPDTLRWNARYAEGTGPQFQAHPVALLALSLPLPAGPVLDLASGPSGSSLLAAAAGHQVLAVDASDVALDLLGREAERRGLASLIRLVHADLTVWRPERSCYALVLCTGYWDRTLFPSAADAVAPGGLIGIEAFTTGALRSKPHLPPAWCLGPGEPASLLSAGFDVLGQEDLPSAHAGSTRRMLARLASGT